VVLLRSPEPLCESYVVIVRLVPVMDIVFRNS